MTHPRIQQRALALAMAAVALGGSPNMQACETRAAVDLRQWVYRATWRQARLAVLRDGFCRVRKTAARESGWWCVAWDCEGDPWSVWVGADLVVRESGLMEQRGLL